jgi:hypothetical protein
MFSGLVPTAQPVPNWAVASALGAPVALLSQRDHRDQTGAEHQIGVVDDRRRYGPSVECCIYEMTFVVAECDPRETRIIHRDRVFRLRDPLQTSTGSVDPG